MILSKWKTCFALALGLTGAAVMASTTPFSPSCPAQRENCASAIYSSEGKTELPRVTINQDRNVNSAPTPFFQRAYTTRVGMAGRRVPSAYLADICLSGESSREVIQDLIAQRLVDEDLKVEPVKDAVYRKLLVARPCA